MLNVSEDTLKSILNLSIQNNKDFATLLDWIDKSYNDFIDRLHTPKSDISITVALQGACTELREIVDNLKNARTKLIKLAEYNELKKQGHLTSKGPNKNFLT